MSCWGLLKDLGNGTDEDQLDCYVAELVRWNKAIRLVGPYDEDGIAEQVVDALLPFKYCPPSFPLLDIGSGAGLPAIPLAVGFPGHEVVCIEPRTKRVSFLRHAARTLGLEKVRVFEGRAEEVIADEPALEGHFRCVTARAVADVETLLNWALPYLSPEGMVVLGRGVERLPTPGGWRLESAKEYVNPLSGSNRLVAAYLRD